MEVSVTSLLIKSLENATKEYAKECIRRCGEAYNFNAEEAFLMLNVENVSIGVREMKKRGAEKKKVEKVEKKVDKKVEKKVEKISIPLPFNEKYVKEEGCHGLAYNKGLFTQCLKNRLMSSMYCKTCQMEADKSERGKPTNGTIEERNEWGMEFKDSKGRKPLAYSRVIAKEGLDRARVELEAGKLNIEIDEMHFAVEKVEKKEIKKEIKKGEKVEVLTVRDLFAELEEDDVTVTSTIVMSDSEDEDEDEESKMLEERESALMNSADLESKAARDAENKQKQEEIKAVKKQAAKEQKLADEKAAKEKKLADEKAAKEKKLADEKAAKEKKLADEKAAKEKKLADEKAAKEQKLADEKAAKEKKLADEKAAKEKKLADEKAAKEKKLADEKAAKEQKRLDEIAAKAAKEQKLADEKAAKEQKQADEKAAKAAKEQKQADEKAAKAAKEQKLADEKAAKEAKKQQQDAEKATKDQKKADAVVEDEAVAEPKKVMIKIKRITIEGRQYLKTSENLLYDPDTKEEVGIFEPETGRIKALPVDSDDEIIEDGYGSD
jgi:hypothetical protein